METAWISFCLFLQGILGGGLWNLLWHSFLEEGREKTRNGISLWVLVLFHA